MRPGPQARPRDDRGPPRRVRRGGGRAESGTPPQIAAATVTIAKEAKAGVLPLFVPKNVPPGTYSFVVRGSGPYPFNKDPKAKDKPNVTLTEPSNPITLTVKPAPVGLTVDNKGGALKQGQKLEIEVTVARQNGFTGPVTLAVNVPGELKRFGPRIILRPTDPKRSS